MTKPVPIAVLTIGNIMLNIINAELWKELNEEREGRVIPELAELFGEFDFMANGHMIIPIARNKFLTRRFLVRQ
jgi:hypothetical protein